MRPDCLVFVTGTGTEVGKSWVTSHVALVLKGQGLAVSARKPVQSFDPLSSEPKDSEVLAEATGELAEVVCASSLTLPVPLAPPMAAAELGMAAPIIADLVKSSSFAVRSDFGFVEGVGGLYSPIASDGDNLDLLNRLKPDLVVIVGHASLGSIHDVSALTRSLGGFEHVVHLNRFDPGRHTEVLNRDWFVQSGEQTASSVAELGSWLVKKSSDFA